jgi:hypothetical protein
MNRVERGCENLSGFNWLSTKSLPVFFNSDEALSYTRRQDYLDYPNDERLDDNSEIIRTERGGTGSELCTMVH